MLLSRRRHILFSFVCAIFLVLSGLVSAKPHETEFSEKPAHIVLLIIDGLSYKVWDKMNLPNLNKMISQGAIVEKLYLPPAAHPTAGAYAELHSGSIPNPIMMSGTLFIDRDTEYLQECFYPEKMTVFIANVRAYETISYNYHVTYQKSGRNRDAVETAVNYMNAYKPVFMRLHLQDTGGAGTRSMTTQEDVPWKWNIWAKDSPYRIEMARADSLVGAFISELDNAGILEDTAFVICGDHGQVDTGWHPPEFPESAITSCILWGPGIRKNVRIPYAELIDLTPTICSLMEVEPPAGCIGRSLDELLSKEEMISYNPKRNIMELNSVLLEYRKKYSEASWLLEQSDSGGKGHLYLRFQREIKEKFYSIDRFSDWTDFSSIESLVAHNRDVLGRLDALLVEIKASR